VAVGQAFLACPDALAIYHADRKWWLHAMSDGRRAIDAAREMHPHATLHAADVGDPPLPGVRHWRVRSGHAGLCAEADALASGGNSGHQALDLCRKLGFRRVLLAGFDMRESAGRKHFFGDYADKTLNTASPFATWVRRFRAVQTSPDFRVINCTPSSALDAFPRGDLRMELGC
jgi:hypothetical protein